METEKNIYTNVICSHGTYGYLYMYTNLCLSELECVCAVHGITDERAYVITMIVCVCVHVVTQLCFVVAGNIIYIHVHTFEYMYMPVFLLTHTHTHAATERS